MVGDITVFCAVVGLLLTWIAISDQGQATKLATFNTVRARIEQLIIELARESEPGKNPLTKAVILERLFNEVEWCALMYQEGLVPKHLVYDHYKANVRIWWDIYRENGLPEWREDSDIHKHFKTLAKEWVGNIPLQRSRVSQPNAHVIDIRA